MIRYVQICFSQKCISLHLFNLNFNFVMVGKWVLVSFFLENPKDWFETATILQVMPQSFWKKWNWKKHVLTTYQLKEEIKVTKSSSHLGWLCNNFWGATKQYHHPHNNMMSDLSSCFMLANIQQFATSFYSFHWRSLWCCVKCLPLRSVQGYRSC